MSSTASAPSGRQTSAPAYDRHLVTAVLVAHNGARWLPQAAAGLRAQTRPPQRFVGVDTGSTDGSAAVLAQLLGAERAVSAPAGTAFGGAVALGVAATDERYGETYPPDGEPPEASGSGAADGRGTGPVQWLWLLHDDAEPEADALAALLRVVDSSPTVAVAGPKLRGWTDRRLLLEVGVTIARSGRRETGLERREHDQGQHDGVHDVLAVSTAGMLVRRDVWHRLGGLDPALPLFRDDVDLGWRVNAAGHRVVCVTDAVVHHAAAATAGRRRLERLPARPLRLDRQHATYVLLANLPLWRLPFALLRLVLGTVLRVLGLLVGKLPANAAGELLALAAVLARPDRLLRARLHRRRTRVLRHRDIAHLLAPPSAGLRHGLEAVTAAIGVGAAASYAAGRHRAIETGPSSEDADDLPSWGSGLARRLLARPSVLLAVLLVALTVVATRDLVGAGRLMGGALLPAPDSAGDLWRTYAESWHPVGVGSGVAAPPYLAVLAAVGTVLLGSASAAVTLVLIGAVPLAGLTAYLALRRLVAGRALRLWGAATYALLPPVTGAVAAGRIGTAAVAVLLPLLGMAVLRVVRGPRLRPAWTAGLLLAVVAALAPVVYLVAAVLTLAAGVSRRLRGRVVLRLGVLLAVPPALLLPWLPALAERPGRLLTDGGVPAAGLTDADLHPAAVFLAHPGGPGTYPLVVTAGLLAAALAALLRSERRALIGAGWATALAGMAAAAVLAHLRLPVGASGGPVDLWPGPATLVAGVGLVVAAVVGAEGARGRLARSNFGWRQVGAAGTVGLAAVVPVLAGAWWAVRGADDPLGRDDPVLLPAFVAAEGGQPARPRTLVLRGRAGRLTYTVLRADGPRLGDADVAAGYRGSGLGGAVSDLASGRGGDAAAALVPYGIRFVLVARPVDPSLAGAVDAVPGLVRVSAPDRAALWKVRYPTGRARLVDAGGRERVLRAGRTSVRTELSPGPDGRRVVLAERADPGWSATLDRQLLPDARADRWAQAFRVPADGGRLVVEHADPARSTLLWVQAGLLLLVVVLALPAARPADDLDQPVPGRAP